MGCTSYVLDSLGTISSMGHYIGKQYNGKTCAAQKIIKTVLELGGFQGLKTLNPTQKKSLKKLFSGTNQSKKVRCFFKNNFWRLKTTRGDPIPYLTSRTPIAQYARDEIKTFSLFNLLEKYYINMFEESSYL